jgi:hypothetical protein
MEGREELKKEGRRRKEGVDRREGAVLCTGKCCDIIVLSSS